MYLTTKISWTNSMSLLIWFQELRRNDMLMIWFSKPIFNRKWLFRILFNIKIWFQNLGKSASLVNYTKGWDAVFFWNPSKSQLRCDFLGLFIFPNSKPLEKLPVTDNREDRALRIVTQLPFWGVEGSKRVCPSVIYHQPPPPPSHLCILYGSLGSGVSTYLYFFPRAHFQSNSPPKRACIASVFEYSRQFFTPPFPLCPLCRHL